MSANAQPDEPALLIAEEILRTIYGDDFKGCTISLERVGTIISEGLKLQQSRSQEVLELYEKVVEALHLLSTPPDADKITDPNALRTLLSQRLDAIHEVTSKTMQTT